MDLSSSQILFEGRRDAGRKLAAELAEYNDKSAVVLAIPNGGVPLGLEVAAAIKADFDVVVSRKIPMPLSPEGGFGAVADDGTIIVSEKEVRKLGLTPQQIEFEAGKVREKVKQRSMLYKGDRPLTRLFGRTVIVVDDGLASGWTMMAAVQSVQHRGCRNVVVAVPVASAIAMKEVQPVASKIVTCATGFMPRFFISDFYRQWHDVSDAEVVQYLKQWRMRRVQQ